MSWLWLCMLLLVLALVSAGLEGRSNAVRHAFAKMTACPSTQKFELPCPGYIIDHLVPLCWGGADSVENMQWQTVSDAKKKDVFEKQACACHQRSVNAPER